MKLLDIINSPWAITPDKLAEIREIYVTHLRGEKIDLHALEAALGRPLAREDVGYEVRGDTAIVALDGPLAKRMNMFSRVSGGTSTELVSRDLRMAAEDPAVRNIVLRIDSPGGTVSGTQELAREVRAIRDEGGKRIIAWTDGQMASAAYWIGSAAEQIYISGDTVQVGSIGVVATHVDASRAEEADGIRVTEITAGRYKRIASSHAPLSAEGAAYMQEHVDYLYSAFVRDVAYGRGVDEETVLTSMADGRVFVGRRALHAGLVDGVLSLDALVSAMNDESLAIVESVGDALDVDERGRLLAFLEGDEMDWSTVTEDQLRAECGPLVESIEATAMAQGASAERQRIADVRATLLPGHESLIDGFVADGTSTGAQAAVAVLAAERGALAARAEIMHREGSVVRLPVGNEEGATDGETAKELPIDERCAAEWQTDAALREEFGSLERYQAYARNNNRVRVFSRTHKEVA